MNFKNWTKYLWSWDKLNQPTPGMVELDLTNFCNANCSWCCSWREHAKPKVSMDFKTFCLEVIKASTKGYGVVFTGGGDPTLHPNFEQLVEVCVDLLDQNKLPAFSLVTNGILYEKVRYFVERTSEPRSWVRVSLNYRKPSEGLIKLFMEYPGRIGLQLIYGDDEEKRLCEQNKVLLEGYAKFVKMAHANHYDIPHPTVNVENCMGRFMHRIVESDGQIAYCCQARGLEGKPPDICPVECRWAVVDMNKAWEMNPFS